MSKRQHAPSLQSECGLTLRGDNRRRVHYSRRDHRGRLRAAGLGDDRVDGIDSEVELLSGGSELDERRLA